MKMTGTTIEVVVQVAGQEALAGRFGEIGSEHILLALLRLADLPLEELGGIVPGVAIAGSLTAEIQALRQAIADHGIESTRVRRRLRAELGRGSCTGPPGLMHRSEAVKKAFEEAARLAHKERAAPMTVVHLLKALLANPTPAMAKVLGDGALKKGAGPAPSPFLERFCKELVPPTKEGEHPVLQGRQAEIRALRDFVALNGRRAAFLIADSDELARGIVVSTVAAISQGKTEPSSKGCRIFEASEPCASNTDQGLANLQGMLEAASSDMVLLLPAITRTHLRSHEWLGILRSALETQRARIICSMSAETYATILARDAVWKRLAQPIWLRQRVDNEVPREL